MYENGTVVEVADGKAKVVFARTAMCKNCGACIKAGPEEMMIIVDNTKGAEVGDIVAVTSSSSSFIDATLIMYGIPLAALLLGVGLPLAFGASDLVSALIGIGCAIASYAVIRQFEPRIKKSKKFGQTMDHIVEKRS